MDDRQLAAIAGAVGTPTYVYDAAVIRERFRGLTAALNARFPCDVHYAVKANSNLAVLTVLRELGAGADIVSGGELFRARQAGFTPDRIVFSGVGKTDEELAEALTAPIRLINLESEAEADRVVALAARTGRIADVGIRVNPDVRAETHPYTRTAEKGVKFGIPLDRVVPLAVHLTKSGTVRVRALGMHLGSQIGPTTSTTSSSAPAAAPRARTGWKAWYSAGRSRSFIPASVITIPRPPASFR